MDSPVFTSLVMHWAHEKFPYRSGTGSVSSPTHKVDLILFFLSSVQHKVLTMETYLQTTN